MYISVCFRCGSTDTLIPTDRGSLTINPPTNHGFVLWGWKCCKCGASASATHNKESKWVPLVVY